MNPSDFTAQILMTLFAALIGGAVTAIGSVAAIRIYIKWLFADVEQLKDDVRTLINRVSALEGRRRRGDQRI